MFVFLWNRDIKFFCGEGGKVMVGADDVEVTVLAIQEGGLCLFE
jgi:hypothetical protein